MSDVFTFHEGELPLLVSALVQQGAEVRCLLTPSAARSIRSPPRSVKT